MSLGDRLPDLHSHDQLFVTLSNLNVYDKIKGSADEQTKTTNRFHWQRHPTGLLQGPTRAFLNTLEAAKHGASNAVSWTIKTVRSKAQEYWNPGAERPLPPESSEPLAEESSPQLLADAVTNAKFINKEIKATKADIERCAAFIRDTDDVNELKVLLHDLMYLQAEMKCAHTGLFNLTETYRGERDSYKAMVMLSGSKYTQAVAKLGKADQNLSDTEDSLSRVVEQLKAKIGEPQIQSSPSAPSMAAARSMGLSTGASSMLFGSSSLSQVFAGTQLPPDFPGNLRDQPNNALVAIENYLSNPILASQPDDRRLTCSNDGELFLYAHYSSESDNAGSDVQNFIHALTETYGVEARNVLVENLRINDGSSLTWGGVKSVIAALPLLVTADVIPNLKGTEKFLSILSEEDRARVKANPAKQWPLVQFALSHIPDGQGNVREIRLVFQPEYKEQMANLEAAAQKKEASATSRATPHRETSTTTASQRSAAAAASMAASPPRSPARDFEGGLSVAPEPAVMGGPPPPPPPPPGSLGKRPAGSAVRSESESGPSQPEVVVEAKTPEQMHNERENAKLLRSAMQRMNPYAFRNAATGRFFKKADDQFISAVAKMTNDELWTVVCGLRSLEREGGAALKDLDPATVEAFKDRPEDEFSNWEQDRFVPKRMQWIEFKGAESILAEEFFKELRKRVSNNNPGPVYEMAPFNPDAAPKRSLKMKAAEGSPADELRAAVNKRRQAKESSSSADAESIENKLAEEKKERLKKPRGAGSSRNAMLDEIRRRGEQKRKETENE